VDGLSYLLDLGFLLQRHGITLPPGPMTDERVEDAAPTGEDGPHGRSPWLHHVLMGDGLVVAVTADSESPARLSDAFIQAHSRPVA
jgi:hypothetical protein